MWLVSYKKHTGRATVGYEAAVCEALAYGWVDSLGRRLDEDRTMLWFSPRKPTSGWSRPNKERVQRLLAEGRMAEPGLRSIEIAKSNGAWTLLDDVENLVLPADLEAAFDQHPGAAEHWARFPRSARRVILEWIVQAKRPETRARRMAEAATEAARGVRANQPRQPGPR